MSSLSQLRVQRQKMTEREQDIVYHKFAALYLPSLVDSFLQAPPPPPGNPQDLIEEFRLNNTYMEMMGAISHTPYFSKFLRSRQPAAEGGKKLMKEVAQRLLDLAPTWDRKMLNTPVDREPGYYESAAGTAIQMFSTLLAAFIKEPRDSPVRVSPEVKSALIPWLRKWERRHHSEFLGRVSTRARNQLEQDQNLTEEAMGLRRLLKNWAVCGKPGCDSSADLKACSR